MEGCGVDNHLKWLIIHCDIDMELVVSNLIQILSEIFDCMRLNVRRGVMLSLTGSHGRFGCDIMEVQLEGLSSTDKNNES